MIKYVIIGFLALLQVVNVFNYEAKQNLRIHFLDIGQGDSILIRTPDKINILIDGGPDASVIDNLGRVMPFYENNIHYVIATHGDADHIAGLIDVFERFNVENFIYNGESKNTILFDRLLELVELEKSNIIFVDSKADQVIGCCLSIDFLWPLNGFDEHIDSNDNSVAFIATYDNFDIYLGGDLSSKYEIQSLQRISKNIEIHKAGHHGSKTSSSIDFLNLINPELTIISVGENNKFNHPDPNLLKNLKNLKIDYLRTDLNGIISLYSDGEAYYIETEK